MHEYSLFTCQPRLSVHAAFQLNMLPPRDLAPLCRIVSFNLEEYETAKQAFDAAVALEPNNKSYQSWTAKCKAVLDSELHCSNHLQ
jgi:hypothetical protein